MVKHKLSGTGELDAIADSVEQLHPIFLFKLLYVLADGRLTDEQFVGSLSETQECSHTSENFQSCIYHFIFLCYFKNPRQYDAECSSRVSGGNFTHPSLGTVLDSLPSHGSSYLTLLFLSLYSLLI